MVRFVLFVHYSANEMFLPSLSSIKEMTMRQLLDVSI